MPLKPSILSLESARRAEIHHQPPNVNLPPTIARHHHENRCKTPLEDKRLSCSLFRKLRQVTK